jgi:hypothetical protein
MADKKLTPMMELIESIKHYRHESHKEVLSIDKVIEVIKNEYLKKERQMIVDTFVDANEMPLMASPKFSGEAYYKKTFKTE